MTTYRYRMHQEDLAKQFGRWYRIAHGDKKTVCLLGIRADESLQRYSGFLNRKYGYKETCWDQQPVQKCLGGFAHIRLEHQRCLARQLYVSI